MGLPLPGVAVRVVDPETGWKLLPPGQEGMLLVMGPNGMLGYLTIRRGRRKRCTDDWYITGDMATIDEDGFMGSRTGSRASGKSAARWFRTCWWKSSSAACCDAPCAVTGLPDERKGERLALFYTAPTRSHPTISGAACRRPTSQAMAAEARTFITWSRCPCWGRGSSTCGE